MRIITIVAQKGGTGKTTTAATLAEGLAQKGNRVLCIDLNDQADLSDTLGVNGDAAGTLQLFTGTPARDIIQAANINNVDIIPAADNLATLDGEIPKDRKGRAFLLKAALQPIRSRYRYCIIDAPGTFNTAFLNALSAADTVIIPALPDYYSLKGIGRLIENIRFVQGSLNPGLKVAGILLTRYNGRRNISKTTVETLEAARDALGTKLFKAKIRESTKIAEAPARRETVLKYAAGSPAAADYMDFINEFLGGK